MDAAPEPLPSMERLRWRCRRGLLELDLLFEAFLEKRYSELPDSDKQAFVRLLEYQDGSDRLLCETAVQMMVCEGQNKFHQDAHGLYLSQ